MTPGRILNRLAFLSICLLLSACIRLGSSAPINLLSAKTVLQEDGSGSNTFLLVVPKEGCDLIPLRSELEKLKEQADTPVYFAGYEDREYKGFELTCEFNNPQQISEQIEHIQRSVVRAIPTPGPRSLVGPPDPDIYGVYDPDQLSIRVEPPFEALTGKEWTASIKFNPLLLTSPSQSCSVPQIAYELVMPGEIASFRMEANAFEDYSLSYIHATQIRPNVIQWTIEPRSIAMVILEKSAGLSQSEFAKLLETEDSETKLLQLLAEEVARLNETADGRTELAKLFDGQGVSEEEAIKLALIGPVYTLTATSTTPASLFQIAIRVVAPIVALLGGIVAVIATVIKIRQSLSKRQEHAQE